MMKKILIILTIALSIVFITSCEENEDSAQITEIDFIGFETGFQVGVDPNGTVAQEVDVAISQASGSDRTFNLAIDTDLTTADPSSYSLPATVTVPANSTLGTFIIDIVGANINASGNDILAVTVSNEDEGLFKSDPIQLNLRQVCPIPETSLEIIFDGFASEITWTLSDASSTVLFAGGGYSDGDPEFSTSICLASGDYTFVVNDSFGDGLSFPDNGSITITHNGAELVSIVGDFGDGATQAFTIP